MVKANVQAIDQLDAERLGSGMMITDRRFFILAVSERMTQRLGWAKEELIGRPASSLFPVERSAGLFDHIAQAVKKDGYWQGEAHHVVKDGQMYASRMNVYALSGSEGEWLVWEFAERKTSLSASTLTSAEVLSTIYASAPFAVVPVAADGTVQDWGNGAEALFGYRKEEAIGRPIWTLFRHSGQTPLPFPPERRQCGEGIVQREDGTPVYIAYTIIPVPSSSGYVVLAEDITKRKQKEGERRRQVELAKKIQHNLLTPLIQNKEVTMEAVYIPSDDLSGDIYACYQIDLYRYGVIVIDVMGHGISSALVSMLLRSLLRGLIVRVIDPVSVASELEKHVQNLFPDETNDMRYLFSMIYLVIDTKEHSIIPDDHGHRTVGADHLFEKADKKRQSGAIQKLEAAYIDHNKATLDGGCCNQQLLFRSQLRIISEPPGQLNALVRRFCNHFQFKRQPMLFHHIPLSLTNPAPPLPPMFIEKLD